MPRLTDQRREVKRAEIVAAARRCFARDGFHRTSMPDVAAEAGVSTGAPYRYFASKEEIILEIAGEAFRLIFAPVAESGTTGPGSSIGEIAAASVESVHRSEEVDAAGRVTPVDELLRCAVQAWAELLVHDGLRDRATRGFEDVRHRIADELARGQEAGSVPADLDPGQGARIVMALLHGLVLQRVAFGLDDVHVADDVRAAFRGAGLLAAGR